VAPILYLDFIIEVDDACDALATIDAKLQFVK